MGELVVTGMVVSGLVRVWIGFFFFKQKTAYEMRISDWSSDVCSSDLLTSFNEVNLGKVMAMRKALQDDFIKANGIKLGFMSFFAKAATNALAKYPAVNASVDGDDIIYHGYADISIAVSTDRGLVTPVLRNVERMSFADVEIGRETGRGKV